MNLHNVVRGVISSINADEPIKFYTNVGQENVKGKVTQVYEVSDRFAQIQAPTASDMKLFEKAADAKHRIKAYVYAPATTINRVTATAGDMLQREDGTYWLVVGTIDDFSREGWLCCLCTLQTKPPEKIKVVDENGEAATDGES